MPLNNFTTDKISFIKNVKNVKFKPSLCKINRMPEELQDW